MPKRIPLFLATIRYLKPRQIFYRIYFTILKISKYDNLLLNLIRRKPHSIKISENIKFVEKSPPQECLIIKGENFIFTFLNCTVSFQKKVDWLSGGYSQLWEYNLHYFDYLLHSELQQNHFNALLTLCDSWIEKNNGPSGSGWDPYPLSLRIVNWIYFYLCNSSKMKAEQKNRFLLSLYIQSTFLYHKVEYHILANHIFKNAKALFIAGVFFDDALLKAKGEKLLSQQMSEQILKDGGHYELSPMYHNIFLEDLLDIYNIITGYQLETCNELKTSVKKNIDLMMQWSVDIVQPDGQIPLFGDSALGIAPDNAYLQKYYRQIVNTHFNEVLPSESTIVFKQDSGYAVFRDGDQYLIMDCGQLGVSYQPGHAHCDINSFEYTYKGKRFIVDSGLSTYEDNKRRRSLRSSSAHNTVVVNNADQAQIWGAFRIGKRVTKIKTVLKEYSVSCQYLYNIYGQKHNYRHKREIRLSKEGTFRVEDHINGAIIQSIVSRINLHPDCMVEKRKNCVLITNGDTQIAVYYDNTILQVEVKDYHYLPDFNTEIPSFYLQFVPLSLQKAFAIEIVPK